MNGFEILMLTTRGQRSGEKRRVALQSLPHGDGWAVIGSYAGEDRDPAWCLNLRADPAADVQIGRARTRVHAREAEGDERADLWRRFVDVDDAYAEYETRTSRRLPVVILERERPGD